MSINKLEICKINKNIFRKQILKNISFNCERGEITGFVGPKNSGKSSLFKVLAGLWNVNSGNIKINGISFTDNRDRFISNIGSLIETPNLYEDLSAQQNFEIMLRLHNIKELSWYNHLISKFDIYNFMNKKIKKYSPGMKQKVGIIMALITDPDIIILDEPTNSLDVTSVRALHDILLTLKKDKIILISSNTLEELDSISDKIFFLKDGTIATSYSHKLTQQYIVELNEPIESTIDFSSVEMVKLVNDKTIKIECVNLNSFLKECIDFNISIRNIKNENNVKNFFDESNESVGE